MVSIVHQRDEIMAEVRVECLDHLGLISGVIKDLRIIELIEHRIIPDDQEEITTGQALWGNRLPDISNFFHIRMINVSHETFFGAYRYLDI